MDQDNKLNQLIEDVQELLGKLGSIDNPQIRTLRDRVDTAIEETKGALAEKAGEAKIQLRDVATSLNNYVGDYPWLAVGTAALVAGTIGFLTGTAAGASTRTWRA
jgi:ElaB/YqjD/DUF883 family membrane-anchored ribosome-binding protein